MIAIKTISALETYPLRKEVLRKNIDLPHTFDGDFEKNTYHFGIFYNNKLIGVLSLMQQHNPNIKNYKSQYQLRGMALSKEYQNLGHGRKLVEASKNFLKDRGIAYLWCNARFEAKDFYKKCGFEIISDTFLVEKIGLHYEMSCSL